MTDLMAALEDSLAAAKAERARPGFQTCDRCGTAGPDVVERTGCLTCGPVPLCGECHEVHEGERAVEAQFRGGADV